MTLVDQEIPGSNPGVVDFLFAFLVLAEAAGAGGRRLVAVGCRWGEEILGLVGLRGRNFPAHICASEWLGKREDFDNLSRLAKGSSRETLSFILGSQRKG